MRDRDSRACGKSVDGTPSAPSRWRGSRRDVRTGDRRGLSQAGTARSVTSRRRLNAALAKRKSQSTFAKPRSFTFRIQAIVLSQPNAGSIRGRAWRLFA